MFPYLDRIKNGGKLVAECRQRMAPLPKIELRVDQMSATQLKELRAAVVKGAGAILEALGTAPQDKQAGLEATHDSAMDLFDQVDSEMNRRSAAGTTAPLPTQRPTGPDMEVRGVDTGDEGPWGGAIGAGGAGAIEHRSGWVDTDGRPVRVLAPTERLCEHRMGGIGVGDMVRAMVKGPRNEREERALAEGNGASGGYTVPAPLASYFIDRLRSQSVCIKAGAQTVDLTSSTLAIARLDSDPASAWAQENAPINGSDMTFSRILFVAKKLVTLVKVSRELLEDSVNVGDAIDAAFAGAMALELDRVGLFGTGVDPQPLGIVNTPGINVVALDNAANGSKPTSYDALIDATYDIVSNNAGDPTAAVYHPRTWQTFAKLKDQSGQPLRMPDDVAKLPRLTSTAVPINETVGTSNDCSSIITGNFKHMMIGVRKQMEIIRADQVFIGNDQIAFLARLRADIQLAHPSAFTHTTGVRA